MVPNIAVLGCGYWGSNHIRTLKNLGALAAVSDIDPNRMAASAKEYNVPALTVDSLFANQTIDAIILALPPQFHAENAIRALAANKDILVEKPIALNVADAEYIVQMAHDMKKIFMVGHVLCFHPAFETLLELVESDALGEIRYIHSHRLGFGKFHTKSDSLWDLAPHDLSMILELTKTEPLRIHGEGTAIIGDLADISQLQLQFPGGIEAHLITSRLHPYRERRLTVIGTHAMAVFDDLEAWERKLAFYRFSIWNENGQWEFHTDAPEYIAIPEEPPLTRELKQFIHSIQTREEPRTNGDQAIAVLKILTAGNRFPHNNDL